MNVFHVIIRYLFDTYMFYVMSMIWTFDAAKNKKDAYRGEDSIKMFCKSLRDKE